MKRMKVLSLIMAVALVIGMLPAFAVSANAASTKVYQANNTDETVLTVYQVRDNLVDNQNGYSTLQNGKAMAQDGFMDKNRALSVTWMVQADEAGTYTFDPLYCIGHFGALKNGIYNMVWCVNDTYYYLGADITSSTIGTHIVSHGMDIVELPLEKGVNIVRMLPIAGPHYEYQKVDRGDGTVVASYINIYKVGIDSRLAVRKSEPLKISMEKADRNANQFITNQFSLVDTDYGFAASGSSYVKNNYATLPNFETLNQSNLSTMPYVSYTLNAPEDGWYDMSLNLSVAIASQYGNTDTKVHYVYAPGNTDGRGDHPDFDGHTKVAGALTEALSDIMGWQLPTGTHATGDCDSATCEFCIRNELTLPLHTYADDCDTTCENCSATRTANAEYAYSGACDASCNNEGCGYERTDAAAHTRTDCDDTECNVCGAALQAVAHSGGTATCKQKAVCTACGKAYGELAKHTYRNGACTVCGASDPNYKPAVNPSTGDEVPLVWLFVALLASGAALIVFRKKYI